MTKLLPQHFILDITTEKVTLKNTQQNIKPIYVDFLSAKLTHRQKSPQRELLKKAMGSVDIKNALIVDATAGFGTDAFILASKGYRVLMIERSDILAALLEDGLKRYFSASPTPVDLRFVHKDAKAYIPQLAQKKSIDIVYLDPMFPENKKTALPSKEMEALRELIGFDDTADELLSIALTHAKYRVVVKRPRLAPPLANRKPSFSLIGKACRFDIYMITKSV